MIADVGVEDVLARVRFWWRVSVTVAAVTMCVVFAAVALLYAGALV